VRHTYIRALIFAAIVALLVALFVFGGLVLKRIEELGTASTDNLQWTVSQIEIEAGKFNQSLLLADPASAPKPDDIKLRFDIFLSRLALVKSGNAADMFALNAQSVSLLTQIGLKTDVIDDILSQPNDQILQSLGALQMASSDLQPNIRALSLIGITLTANAQKQRRAEISQTLMLTGGIAASLIIALFVLLAFLDRLRRQNIYRDKELQQTTSLLSSTVSASLDAIIVADTNGQIIGYNASAEEILGWTESEILGQNISTTIVPHIHRDAHAAGMKRYLETKQPRVVNGGRVELTALRKSGEEFPIEINITSVEVERETRFIAYLRDISARKESEQKLIAAKEQAEAADKAKSRFLAVMSHEMRTPLNGVLGVLDLLKETKVTATQRRYVEIAAASSEILLQLVNEALDITRIETGTTQLDAHPFVLRELVGMVVDALDPLAREKTLDLSLHFASNVDQAFLGDANRIRQIVTNLIGNAIKFTEHGGIEVVVHGQPAPDHVDLVIDVVDTGRGIDPENLIRVFEDFVAVGSGAGRQTRNDGLGLSISKRIAQLMGGDLTVKSTPGVGSKFTLTMPLLKAPEPVHSLSEDLNAAEADPQLVHKTALIVEDNDINRSVLKDILLKLGMEIEEARNGLEAVEKSKSNAFDVILMDISMPLMDGLEATRHIRTGPGKNTGTRIFGLTAHGQEDLREAASQAGMTDLYSKPIRLPMLVDLLSDKTPGRTAPIAAEHDILNRDIWSELTEALGSDKAVASAKKLLHEVEVFKAEVRDLFEAQSWDQIGQRSHKLQGAAALLGLEAMSGSLKALSDSSRTEDKAKVAAALADLSHTFGETQTRVLDKMDTSD
jgi:PAS domain S-box-containing protein